jgi:hypothetical protein
MFANVSVRRLRHEMIEYAQFSGAQLRVRDFTKCCIDLKRFRCLRRWGRKVFGDLCGAYRVGDSGMSLPAQFDIPEIGALVSTKLHLIIYASLSCTKISADEQSFGARNHDVVTTSE